MAVFSLKKRELICKIVYYGPARGGKTSNLKYLSEAFKDQVPGKIISIETQHDKTLFFDFLPMDLGQIGGLDIRVQLYTVPGQVRYSTTRKLVLRGADGIVFVADSLRIRWESNMRSLKDLEQNLRALNISISQIPLVLQFNKRDLDGMGIPLMPIDDMERGLNRHLKAPSFPASVVHGQGIRETLKKCLQLTLHSLEKTKKWPQRGTV